ncbi:MAG: M23 family metallopeptidase [Rhodothermia bacterium]
MRAATVVLIVILVGAAIPPVQDNYPTDYFRSPIGIPIILSGTFGELRSNHFHSGLDIKTNGKQGYRVYATAAGYVSRIKVSPTGFGNALYVRHPNGYTTVYAHLRNFADPIQDYVRRQQYRAKSFPVDLYPEASVFVVDKGEVIAFSGNSGGSGGPHLHFEIRDSGTEWPLNPLLFGLDLKDTQPPQIRSVKIYAMDDKSAASIMFTNGRSQKVTRTSPALLKTAGNGRSFDLAGVRSVSAIGRIGFGIETRDTHNGSRSRLGLYRISLFADDSPVFEYLAEKFSFSKSRYINAHIDYAEREQNKRWVQRSYLLPGNELPSYRNVVNEGILEFGSGSRRVMRYEVVDAPGNKTTLSFVVQGDAGLEPPAATGFDDEHDGELIRFGEAGSFTRSGFKAEIPEGAVYEDTRLNYGVVAGDDETFSNRYVFHDPSTPVHERIELSIEADNLPVSLRDRAALAYEDDEGKVSFQTARYRDGWVTARIRTLGQYFLSADTLDPKIKAINISDGRNMAKSYNFRFKIWDDETGVASYEGYVDGDWVLFEYDPKSRMLVHTFDGSFGRGSHTLKLTVTDNVGNSTTFESRFTR